MSNISSAEIAYKKKIGKIGNDPVLEVGLIGGLHMVIRASGGKTETLGCGPHRAVARHLAKKRNPGLELTDLSKSEQVDPSLFEDLLPKYEALTDAFRDAEKK